MHNEGGTYTPSWTLINELKDVDGRGSAYGDIDGDGDLDIVVGRRNDRIQVLENKSKASDGKKIGTFLQVAIVPLTSAVGATITIEVAGKTQVRVIQAGSGYLSSSPPTAHFGLCGVQKVDKLEIQFVDGSKKSFLNVPSGKFSYEKH